MFHQAYLRRLQSVIILVVVALIFSTKSVSQSNGKTIIFTNAKVIDGVSGRPIKDASVVIADGKIKEISTAETKTEGAKVIDLKVNTSCLV